MITVALVVRIVRRISRSTLVGAIAGILLLLHSKIEAAMGYEFVDFFEGIPVEKKRDAFSRGQLAVGFLPVLSLLAAAEFCSAIHCNQLFDA